MKEQRLFVDFLLNLKHSNQDRKSCLSMSLKGARKLTGRDVYTGKDDLGLFENEELFKKDLYHSSIFTGITLYFIFLEQVGAIFKRKNYDEENKTNCIRIALENFTNLKKEEILVIVELRNSIAHNFSLSSVNNPYERKKNEKNNFIFELRFDNCQQLLKINSNWSGDFNDIEGQNTVVCLKKFCELVDNVYKQLLLHIEKNEIVLRIDDLNELKARFTIK